MTDLENRFEEAMIDIYHRAKTEANYNATQYLQMLMKHRGLETAKILLHAGMESEGYTVLWERKRLDLTVEALILKADWNGLISEEERQIARERLRRYGYAANGEAVAPQLASRARSSPETVKAIKGKYAHVSGSSEAFLAEKHRDTCAE